MRNAKRETEMHVHSRKYKRVNTANDVCIYCGTHADEWDHVPPYSLASSCYGTFIKVRSCRECNHNLNNQPLFSIKARRTHLLIKYFAKYGESPEAIRGTFRYIGTRLNEKWNKYIPGYRPIKIKGVTK